MKKNLLLASSIFVSGMLCAQVAKKASNIPTKLANVSAKKIDKNMGGEYAPSFMTQTAINNTPKIVSNQSSKTAMQTDVLIGQTYYDLQTNSSIGNRIVVNADGSIAATWTMEFLDAGTTYPNRGTGYNYYTGSAWGAAPTARIENARTGWGEIVNTASGKETVMSHGISGGKIDVVTRPTKGSGTWTDNITAMPTATTGGNFWPRMVSSNTGDTIYAISLTYPTGSGGAIYQGLDGGVVFSRSFDGGATWNLTNVVPTGLTSNEFRGFGGDAYAITAKGSVVAIVAGDSDKDVVMVKSTDAGATWTATKVWDLPIDKWDHTVSTSDFDLDGTADTLDSNDGSFAIALDNNNEVYVSFGAYRILQDAVATTQTWSYFPYTDGLYLWKESNGAATFPNQTAVMVAAIEDLYQQGTIYLPTPTTAGDSPFGSFGSSLTSFPSMAFDGSNNLYLSYSAVGDSMISLTNTEKNVRHQYIVNSCDGGVNFSVPYDVVGSQNGIATEGVFGSLASRVNGSLHLIYEKDLYPGYGVNSTADADNQGDLKDIVYVNIPLTDLPSCSGVTGINNIKATTINMNFYPNPASNNATIDVVLNETAKVDISILNSVGQSVYTTSVSGTIGSNKVNINLNNLAAGLYFYQVKLGNSKAITNKFAVEK